MILLQMLRGSFDDLNIFEITTLYHFEKFIFQNKYSPLIESIDHKADEKNIIYHFLLLL